VIAHDAETGTVFCAKGKVVINATGAFSDNFDARQTRQ